MRRRSAGTADVVLGELAAARRLHPLFDAAFERFAAALGEKRLEEAGSRRLATQLATLVQARILLEAASVSSLGARAVAEGFCATRLDPASGWGAVFGTGVHGSGARVPDARAILGRAWAE